VSFGSHRTDIEKTQSSKAEEMSSNSGSTMSPETARKLKYLSLLTLTAQNAVLGLSMRYSRTRPGDLFYEATAVLMAEFVKFFTCLWLVYKDVHYDFDRFKETLYVTIWVNKMDTIKVCIPSFIYLVQNNLLYVAASNLDVATYQITYQLKILTTAIFAVIMLKKQLIKSQWLSLLLLIIGVAMVQLSDAKEQNVNLENQSRFKGFVAALSACILSGLAGIYFEKILKGSEISVWMRNVQLSLLSVPFGIAVVYFKHGDQIAINGFFFGYDLFVWYLVVLNATGGLLVAVVIKYADNILKGFACSLAIILTCALSVVLFGFELSLQFVIGAAFVIGSIFLYGYQPKKPSDTAA